MKIQFAQIVRFGTSLMEESVRGHGSKQVPEDAELDEG
jgi:hypothetical protein